MRGLMIAGLAVAAAACGGTDEPPVDVVAELGAPGPYGVGFKSAAVTYAVPLTGEMRTTEVLTWYPTAAGLTGDRPLYLLKASEVAVIDAPAIELPAPAPVVVFSHGHQTYASVMSYFMEHLASHGFVAIAPMHTGNTFADGDDRETEIYYLRSHDVEAALDRFGTGGSALLMGHSFGGYTTYATVGARYDIDALAAACTAGTGPAAFCSTMDADKAALFRDGLREPRFLGAFAIDSGDFDLFGAAGVANVRVPVLHMVAEASVPTVADDKYWGALQAPDRTRVFLKGGDHNDFMDSCGAGAEIRCSALPPAQVQAMVRVYGLAFVRWVLRGDQTVRPVLTGDAFVSSLTELETVAAPR